MASPSSSNRSKQRIKKIGAPVFKPGMGDIYRELEKSGRLRIDRMERRAAMLAEKALQQKSVARVGSACRGLLDRIQKLIGGN